MISGAQPKAASRRVLYTSMNDLSMFGGTETMITQEVSYLSEHGFEVNILAPPPKNALRFDKSTKMTMSTVPERVYGLPWLVQDFLTAMWMAFQVRKQARRGRIVSISFSAMDGMGPALAKLTGSDVRMVLRIVGPLSYEVEHFAQVERLRYKVYSRVFRLVEAFTYLVADLILPISEFELNNVKSYGIEGNKVRLVRCGIDSSKFGGRSNKRLLAMPANAEVVMFVGRLVEKNGPLVIAEAVSKVLSEVPDARFVFVGDGPLRDRLETRLADLVKSRKVIFTGYRTDIADLHAEAQVYVGHVSSKVEGLGQTVFEAMMSGLPVVAGDDAISREIIASGKNGILVRKDDPEAIAAAVVTLLRDSNLRARIGAAARRSAEESLSFNSMMSVITSAQENA